MIKKIIVDHDFVTEIQKNSIEAEARKNIISFMISQEMNINCEQFKQYQDEYVEYFTTYEMLKDQLYKLYIQPLQINSEINWELDYSNDELTLYMED